MKPLEKLKLDYETENIKALISLFQKNLVQAETIFKQGSKQDVQQTLHKLKGGIKILHLITLEAEISILERDISLYGCNNYLADLLKLINNSLTLINSILIEIN